MTKRVPRKRTYRDSLGCKHRRNDKDVPQFGTVKEYNDWIESKRMASRALRPNDVFNGPVPDPGAKALRDLLASMEKDLATRALSGTTGTKGRKGDDSPR